MGTLNSILIAGLAVLLLASLTSLRSYTRRYLSLRKSHERLLCSHADCLDRNLCLQYCLAEYASAKAGQSLPAYGDGQPWHPLDEVTFRPAAGGGIRKGTVMLNLNKEGFLQDDNPLVLAVGEGGEEPERTFLPGQVSDVRLSLRPQCRKALENIDNEITE